MPRWWRITFYIFLVFYIMRSGGSLDALISNAAHLFCIPANKIRKVLLVNTLSPKGDSFSGHAWRNRLRWVLNARTKRFECLLDDIPGRIHLPVQFQTTDRTAMHTHIQILLDPLSALTAAAHLGAVCRVHGNQLATSFCRFVDQHFREHPQPWHRAMSARGACSWSWIVW